MEHMAWYLPAERYTDNWKPLPLPKPRGRAVAVFASEHLSRAFIEANWDSLGPGWLTAELRSE